MDDSPFDSFLCPITGDMMDDPVVTIADGHTYERYAIEEWFRRGHRTSPLTGLLLSSTTVVANITLRNAVEEWRLRNDLAKTPRVSSPGEERRRALHAALDMREVRLQDMKGEEPSVDKEGCVEDRESLAFWLRTRSALSAPLVSEYCELLAREGATSMSFLRDADYGRRDLVDLGVRVPHVASILRVVNLYAGREGPATGLGGALRDGPVCPEAAQAENLAAALRTVVSCAPLDANHPLVIAVTGCGLRVELGRGPVTSFALLVRVLRLIKGSASVATAGLEVVRTLSRDEHSRRSFGEAGVCEVVVPTMRAFPAEASVAAEGCWSIRNLAIDDGLAALLASFEACSAVVTAMASFPAHRATQEQAAAAIVNLGGNNRELKRALAAAGATGAVLSAMRAFPTDPEVLKQCCWAILTLAVDDEIARRLSEEGACAAVVGAMRACPTERLVLTKACAAIVNLSGGNQAIKSAFGELGACAEVIHAMAAYPTDAPLQKQVCWAIKNLAGGNDPNRRRFCGGLGGVVNAVRHFGADRDVAEQALGALRTLAVDDDNARELGGLGACELLVVSMRALPTIPGIQVQACGSIINLCGNNPDNRRRLAAAGACDLVALSLRQHRHDRGVQEQACWAVTSLGVGTPENRKRLGECGACASVAAALRTFPSDRAVIEQAVAAIRNLAIEEENTKRLGSEGACEGVVNAMRMFHGEPLFLSKACAAVVNLAGGNADNKRRLGMGGAIECVLGALRMYPLDGAIVEQGLWAVKNLAVDPENTQRLGAAGICELIVAALQNFGRDTRVLAQALAAAVNVSGGNDENKRDLGARGGCELIVWAMQAFPSDKVVQLQGCWAIKNLCNNMEDNKRRLGPAACEAVVRALRLHRAEEGVQREGKAALRNLSNGHADNRATVEALEYTEHLQARPSLPSAAVAGLNNSAVGLGSSLNGPFNASANNGHAALPPSPNDRQREPPMPPSRNEF